MLQKHGSPRVPASDEHMFAWIANLPSTVGRHLLWQYNEMCDLLLAGTFTKHVITALAVVSAGVFAVAEERPESVARTPTQDRESIVLAMHRLCSPTAQLNIHRSFWEAIQHHQRTGAGISADPVR